MPVATRWFATCVFVLAALSWGAFGGLPCAAAAEKWVDSRLKAPEGLQMWLDGSHAWGEGIRPFDGKLPVWFDGSGKQRHLRQADVKSQPLVLPHGSISFVRFDGLDDHLRALDQQLKLQSFTLFVVAAPRHNAGLFRALLAGNAKNQRDYTSGFTVDLGPAGSPDFSTLNVEGLGFGGAANLRTAKGPLRRLSVLEISSNFADRPSAVRLRVDGPVEGERPRTAETLQIDELTVGARYYNNGAGPQQVDGYGRCDLAEVLLFDRVLSDAEATDVRNYLVAKYDSVRDSLPIDADHEGDPLTPERDPPAVQVFPPGFEVRELPVHLPNINNVLYRPDGTLVALGYDGRIWLLRDRNGDGVEESVELFWNNPNGLRSTIGMDLTPPDYPRGDGAFVVGKTKCVLVVDTDRDGKADQELEIAGGWKESFHNVDGLGVAFDRRDGSVYFGRGTYNFSDPFLRDKEGRSHYSLADESSTVLRVAPDFKTREIVATGIRFPVALRFNRAGDLFATDQEGATWVPNGNPFDELLHIQKGRHYGFPARHPRDLPHVIDEPSTFDYGPQHQSTCGLNFNEPARDGAPIFGPANWRGDAIVTGYSRGKLYRTELVPSTGGYVARTSLLAALQMLTVDACVGPAGELLVACHSGGPDWGSGPTGKGKLYKIRYADGEHPQPALIWATGPREVRVEFDRPVEPSLLKETAAVARLEGGPFVRAGDRFETLLPGYAVVQLQRLAPRWRLPIHSAQLTPDRRSLLLSVDPLPGAVSYALQLPGMGRPTSDSKSPGVIAQRSAIDLDFDLNGCQAKWTPADGSPAQTVSLPHLDLEVARALTRGSAPHDAFWAAFEQAGTLTLRARLDLTNLLRPAVQPGSQLDYELPAERAMVSLRSSEGELSWLSGLGAPKTTPRIEVWADRSMMNFVVEPAEPKLITLGVQLQKKPGRPTLEVHWRTAEDERPRALPLRRIWLPWVDPTVKPALPSASAPALELAGGSWSRGRREFFSQDAACAKCHAVHGQGGSIGPDLSNLIHRDYASVMRDIVTPSFAINPDHLTYSVACKDGRSFAGVIHAKGDKLIIGTNKGELIEVARDDVEELQPSPISTMPEGLPKLIGSERLRDLLTFLLTPPPSMPRDYPGPRPRPRSVAEVQAVLAGAPQPSEPIRPLRIALVAGPKDHGPGEHDYPAWQKAWKELFAIAEQVEVTTAWEWPTKEELARADVLVIYQHGDFPARRATELDEFLARGGGVVYIHWAIDGRMFGREMAERTGLAALGGVGFRHGPLTLKFNTETKHPALRNFQQLELVDESYWKMVGSLASDRLLATAVEEGADQPQLWSLERGKGRVFVSIPGHYSWTFDDPLFRILLLRGIAWSARQPVDRFNDLVWPGASLQTTRGSP